MNVESFDRLLAMGPAEEVDDLIDADHCAVVDWRSEPEETVEAFQAFLPDGFLRYEFPDDDHLLLHTGPRTTTLALAPKLPAIPLADQLRGLLPPEHGAFLLRSSLGSDTACYVVRSAKLVADLSSGLPGPLYPSFHGRQSHLIPCTVGAHPAT